MIVLTPTEAATLRAVLERVAAECGARNEHYTPVAMLVEGELLFGVGEAWEVEGVVELAEALATEDVPSEACPECAQFRARIEGLGYIINGGGDGHGD